VLDAEAVVERCTPARNDRGAASATVRAAVGLLAVTGICGAFGMGRGSVVTVGGQPGEHTQLVGGSRCRVG
jgi:hypothetical protein